MRPQAHLSLLLNQAVLLEGAHQGMQLLHPQAPLPQLPLEPVDGLAVGPVLLRQPTAALLLLRQLLAGPFHLGLDQEISQNNTDLSVISKLEFYDVI